jgi:hypothetical protein
LTLDNEQVAQMINRMDNESKAIKKEALRFSWYMRGGLSYEDAMFLSSAEREIVSAIIKSNMEATKESGLPFF